MHKPMTHCLRKDISIAEDESLWNAREKPRDYKGIWLEDVTTHFTNWENNDGIFFVYPQKKFSVFSVLIP